MGKLPYQQIASKALKTMILQKNSNLQPVIPETSWYHPNILDNFLEKHKMIYLKPDKGGGGSGVSRITLVDKNQVEYKNLFQQKVLERGQLISWVEKRMQGEKKYIIQQGINLAVYKGRPFDLRTNLQKPNQEWITTGVCAKVAAPGKIVTNHCKGGIPLDGFKLLVAITKNSDEAQNLYSKLLYYSQEIAKTMNERFKGVKELGIDIGIDNNLNYWIFEVNTRPDFKMFRSLGNWQVYNRIIKTHKMIV